MRDELYMSDRECWNWAWVFLGAVLFGLLLGMTACTPQEQAKVTAFQAAAAPYQAQIAQACAVAMTLAPVAGPIAPYILGGCASEAAIAKLALDPSSLLWVESLVAKAKGTA